MELCTSATPPSGHWPVLGKQVDHEHFYFFPSLCYQQITDKVRGFGYVIDCHLQSFPNLKHYTEYNQPAGDQFSWRKRAKKAPTQAHSEQSAHQASLVLHSRNERGPCKANCVCVPFTDLLLAPSVCETDNPFSLSLPAPPSQTNKNSPNRSLFARS